MEKIKLMLGDCLNKMKEIETKHIDLALTDPPYGTTQSIELFFNSWILSIQLP